MPCCSERVRYTSAQMSSFRQALSLRRINTHSSRRTSPYELNRSTSDSSGLTTTSGSVPTRSFSLASTWGREAWWARAPSSQRTFPLARLPSESLHEWSVSDSATAARVPRSRPCELCGTCRSGTGLRDRRLPGRTLSRMLTGVRRQSSRRRVACRVVRRGLLGSTGDARLHRVRGPGGAKEAPLSYAARSDGVVSGPRAVVRDRMRLRVLSGRSERAGLVSERGGAFAFGGESTRRTCFGWTSMRGRWSLRRSRRRRSTQW